MAHQRETYDPSQVLPYAVGAARQRFSALAFLGGAALPYAYAAASERPDVMPQTLRELSNADDVRGSSRLQIHQCFAPRRVVTLTFGVERVGVEITGRDATTPESGTVHYDNAPEWARSWEEFCRFALPLEDCRNLGVYDGTRYIHSMFERERETSVTWVNPGWLENPLQMTVVRGYMELVEAAGLRRLLRMRR